LGKRREGIGHVGNLFKMDRSTNGIAARPIDLMKISLWHDSCIKTITQDKALRQQ
jgi:hypothetical protein